MSLFSERTAEIVTVSIDLIFVDDLGSDAILLGAETHRGLYPVETVRTVGRICFEVSEDVESFVVHR